MYYRDLIFTVPAADLRFFRDAVMMKLHEQHHRLGCAIAFPAWEDNEENVVDTFDPFTRHANPGPVVRLFAEDRTALEKAPVVLAIDELLDKGIMTVTPVKEAPKGCGAVAFCRTRRTDGHIRKAKRSSEPLMTRHRREAELRRTHHRQAYIKVDSTKGHAYSLYYERQTGEAPSEQIQVSSYGLSRSSAPCYLPDF